MIIEERDSSSTGKSSPEEEIKHLAAEIEEQFSPLDHYFDYTQRLCESDTHGVGNKKSE